MTNVLWLCIRKGRIDIAGAQAFLDRLGSLNIASQVVPAPEVLKLSVSLAITTYDASYLWLAIDRNLPLATLDRRLRSAATQSGITTLPA